MKKCILALLLIAGGVMPTRGQGVVEEITSIDTLHFQLSEANNLLLKGVLNEVDTLTWMLHTAANSLTMTEEATERIASLAWDSVDSTESWGGQQAARRSSNNTLSMGTFSWDSLAIWENTHSGPGTDGKFGLNLFAGKVVEINFEEELLLIHSELPHKLDTYTRMDLTGEGGLYFIEGTIRIEKQAYAHKFLIHSGYKGTLLLDDEFAKEAKLGEQLDILKEEELRDSYGNVLINQQALLPEFEIGQSSLTHLPIGFFKGSIGRQKMSVLGGEMLKRFHIIWDLDGKTLYLKKNKWASTPFETG